MAQHQFELKASWTGGRDGKGHIAVGGLRTDVSVPKALNGPGEGTNPEEMLLGAAAACYLITLSIVLQSRGLSVAELRLTSEGVVNDEGGLHFETIVHHPVIVLAAGATVKQMQSARTAAELAERACMISKAVRGNVAVTVKPTVIPKV
jgi:peroxiredoxin-like protein